MGLSGSSLHPSYRPAGREEPQGNGNIERHWGTMSTRDWEARDAGGSGFLHWSRAEQKCMEQAEEDGGWDVSHLASRSRWGCS